MKTKRITRLAAVSATACASLGLAATASAGTKVSDVREHVQRADAALERADTLVSKGRDGRATAKLRKANAQTRRADSDANRVRGAKKSSRAEKMVAKQYDQNIDVAVDLVDEVASGKQAQVLEVIAKAVDGREVAIGELNALLDRVPAQAVPGLTRAIAAVTASGAEQLEELVVLATTGEISPEAAAALEAVVAQLGESLASIVAQLEAVLATLPPEAQPHVQAAIDRIESVLTGLIATLEGLLSNVPVGSDGLVPPVPAPLP